MTQTTFFHEEDIHIQPGSEILKKANRKWCGFVDPPFSMNTFKFSLHVV